MSSRFDYFFGCIQLQCVCTLMCDQLLACFIDPGVPTNLEFTQEGGTARFSWSAPNSGVQYQLTITVSGENSPVDDRRLSESSYSNDALSPGGTFIVKVYAIINSNQTGEPASKTFTMGRFLVFDCFALCGLFALCVLF